MKTPLTPLQLKVAEWYQDGTFAHVETQEEAENVGDTLFSFAIREAAEVSGPYDYSALLCRAIDELKHLQHNMEAL